MEKENLAKAEAYYTLVGQKNAEAIGSYLHPDVVLVSPMATLKGREKVVSATANYMKFFRTLKIRTHFSNPDQAIVVYDSDLPGISTAFPGASLLTFQKGLIVRIELFYDASRMLQKKEEIFSET